MNTIYGEIDILRERLNNLIEKEEDFEEIYKLSTELDQLILNYYADNDYGNEYLEA
ncbi:Spo0E family sporulation regulatory protein-aspartic acid phosphatase [Defluviitalea phaphyphila]|uniref:Spo0E family sporulation regulatory protein-aspartic acid phosphatase n=1 Tax=Defluviitalea phaphyphila TaxID=1473580 RepID=UPI0009FE2D1E|nr:Spo0E family sporulation regulatory protein-aspartic acid phosphatase [Defluviitalea phaphyphila]